MRSQVNMTLSLSFQPIRVINLGIYTGNHFKLKEPEGMGEHRKGGF